MRFAIAVAFLGQALLPAPTESETVVQPIKSERQRLMRDLLVVAGGTTHGLRQQRTFTGGRGAGLGAGLQTTFEKINANQFKAGGKLKNKSRRASQDEEDKRECDPKSDDDPDIGILSCGLGKYCVESNESSLGGLCMNPIIRSTKTGGSPFGGLLLKNKNLTSKRKCDPSINRNEADIGLLACGMGQYCKDNEDSILGGYCAIQQATSFENNKEASIRGGTSTVGGGALKNKARRASQGVDKKECDPKSTDLDIGILSCGLGKYCMENEESFIGGFCAAQAADLESKEEVSRRTEYYKDSVIPAELCMYADRFGCDCSEVDIISGTGSVTCIPFETLCFPCDDICLSYSSTYSFTGNVTDTAEICYYFTSPYERKACYYGDFRGLNATCTYAIDDLTCDLCAVQEDESNDFDCTNTVPEAKAGSTSDDVRPLPIIETFLAAGDLDPTSCLNVNEPIGGGGDYYYDDITPEHFCTDEQCNCDGFDFASGNGTIDCNIYENQCYPCDGFCFSFSVSYTFSGNTTETSGSCFYVTAPYERKACYSLDHRGVNPTCSYSIDDQACDLCVIREDTYTDFDCTNTVAEAHAGSTADGVYPLPIIEDFVGHDGSFDCFLPTLVYVHCVAAPHDDPYFSGLDCDCSQIDPLSLTGTFNCSSRYAYCPSQDWCFVTSFTYSIAEHGLGHRREDCYDFISPYERQFCYEETNVTTVSSEELTCSVDGVACNKCMLNGCHYFDCTNTIVNTEGGGNYTGNCDRISPLLNEIFNSSTPSFAPSQSASPTGAPSEWTESLNKDSSALSLSPTITDAMMETTPPTPSEGTESLTKDSSALSLSPTITDAMMEATPPTDAPTEPSVDRGPSDGALQMSPKPSQTTAVVCALAGAFLAYFL